MASGDKEAYNAYMNKMLQKYKVSSPDELDTDEKKKFFNEVDDGWESDAEAAGEEVEESFDFELYGGLTEEEIELILTEELTEEGEKIDAVKKAGKRVIKGAAKGAASGATRGAVTGSITGALNKGGDTGAGSRAKPGAMAGAKNGAIIGGAVGAIDAGVASARLSSNEKKLKKYKKELRDANTDSQKEAIKKKINNAEKNISKMKKALNEESFNIYADLTEEQIEAQLMEELGLAEEMNWEATGTLSGAGLGFVLGGTLLSTVLGAVGGKLIGNLIDSQEKVAKAEENVQKAEAKVVEAPGEDVVRKRSNGSDPTLAAKVHFDDINIAINKVIATLEQLEPTVVQEKHKKEVEEIAKALIKVSENQAKALDNHAKSLLAGKDDIKAVIKHRSKTMSELGKIRKKIRDISYNKNIIQEGADLTEESYNTPNYKWQFKTPMSTIEFDDTIKDNDYQVYVEHKGDSILVIDSYRNVKDVVGEYYDGYLYTDEKF
jgi:hypothetical protein